MKTKNSTKVHLASTIIKKPSMIKISPKLLLSVYAIIPISLILIFIDSVFLKGRVASSLPVDPRVYTWFVLIFMLPHIVASFFSFAEREYFNHYKPQLLRGSQIAVALGLFIPALIGGTMVPIAIFATYTMIHVFMQQSGVSKSLMKNSIRSHNYWQWTGIAISTLIYAYLLIPLPWLSSIVSKASFFIPSTTIILIIYSLIALKIVKHSRTAIGSAYFIATHSMPIIGILCVATGYPILALVIPRVIHDITAYSFYISHDHNRYLRSPTNKLYKLTSTLKLPVYIASPLLSIGLSFTIAKFNSTSLSVILTCVFFLHYYTESIIWKKDTLHRMQIHYS